MFLFFDVNFVKNNYFYFGIEQKSFNRFQTQIKKRKEKQDNVNLITVQVNSLI